MGNERGQERGGGVRREGEESGERGEESGEKREGDSVGKGK